MDIKKTYYQNLSETIIKNLNKRQMDACYFETKEEACEYVLTTIPKDSTISWGGSMSLFEAGIIDGLYANGSYNLLDRAKVAPEKMPELLRQVFFADYYLMSSNALTVDGRLINVDGAGNRVSALIFGPTNVFVLVGMNKIVTTEDEGINRVHNVASPQNCVRLNKKTPCSITGTCADCLSPDCICAQTVITRRSQIPNRIKVILVGESLGY